MQTGTSSRVRFLFCGQCFLIASPTNRCTVLIKHGMATDQVLNGVKQTNNRAVASDSFTLRPSNNKESAMPEQQHSIDIALLKQQAEQTAKDLAEIKASVKTLASAWESAGLLISIVKTAAAIVVSITILIGALKYGITPAGADK